MGILAHATRKRRRPWEPEYQTDANQTIYALDRNGDPVVKAAMGNVPLDYDLWAGMRNTVGDTEDNIFIFDTGLYDPFNISTGALLDVGDTQIST